MGSNLSSNTEPPVRVLVTGLDNAGKTTMIHTLKMADIHCSNPTLGLYIEHARFKNLTIYAWDSDSHGKRLKPHFTPYTSAVIYFVDVSNQEMIDESIQELHDELANVEKDNKTVPLLIFANKIDLPGALSVNDIIDKFGLNSMTRPWHVQPSIATEGVGLNEGLDWLMDELERLQLTAACDVKD